MSEMTMRDAAVAVRSLPRRYGEILAGPKDDDVWDRMVRTIGASGRSAAGWAAHAATLVTALGTAIAALPLTARPSVDLAKIVNGRQEPARTVAIEYVLHELADVADRAATAIEGRQHDDFDRVCLVDGAEMPASQLVTTVVQLAVSHLRDASAAIEQARDR